MKTLALLFFAVIFSLTTKHVAPIIMTPTANDTILCTSHDTAVQLVVEKNAEFQNGDILKFRKYVMSKIVMPKAAIINRYQGKAIIKFIVDWDGQVRNVVVYKSSGYKILDYEAVRVIKKSPLWTSAKNSNVCVPQQMIIPIEFINFGVFKIQDY